MTDDDALIARIKALSDVAYWANVKWIIPGDATQAIGKLAVEAAARIAALTAEIAQWKTWGIIEVAIRNPNVKSYMEHWEGRATKAEAALAERAAREKK